MHDNLINTTQECTVSVNVPRVSYIVGSYATPYMISTSKRYLIMI